MRRTLHAMSFVFAAALLPALMALAASAQTETPGTAQQSAPSAGQENNPADVPHLKLNEEQKHAIYASVSSQNNKETAPSAFLPNVGAVIPTSITLRPLPDAILKLMPELKDYQQAFVANQVVLADPGDRKIVEHITQ
jgi:glucose/arabinose dehydrogenase